MYQCPGWPVVNTVCCTWPTLSAEVFLASVSGPNISWESPKDYSFCSHALVGGPPSPKVKKSSTGNMVNLLTRRKGNMVNLSTRGKGNINMVNLSTRGKGNMVNLSTRRKGNMVNL